MPNITQRSVERAFSGREASAQALTLKKHITPAEGLGVAMNVLTAREVIADLFRGAEEIPVEDVVIPGYLDAKLRAEVVNVLSAAAALDEFQAAKPAVSFGNFPLFERTNAFKKQLMEQIGPASMPD
jgi:hypothetical protein